jgi:two-component system C4-dicarboxylate transport sensor histidine kinase DctB
MLALILHQRRRTALHNRVTTAALRRAREELERKVDQRTQALSTANSLLRKEVADRVHAEQVLKNTMEELVHAGRMAALGQMSASVTHELNQPLAALRTIAANTIVFFERGNTLDASANLTVIGDLVERMGRITGQLKKFAYKKTPVRCEATPLAAVVSDSLVLLGARAREEGVRLDFDPAASELHAWCEPTRLGQVLLNLVGNALDAVRGRSPAWVRVILGEEPGAITIEVRDNGSGLADEVMPHLFEPFFTTKEQGAGLGLGLAISAEIVRGFGGTLCAWNAPEGGAVFCVRLPHRTQVQETMAWTQVS